MAHPDPAASLHREMTKWRRHLHQHPEFGFEEENTAAFVVEKLKQFGIDEIATGVGGTGVVATLRAGTANRAIAFRADMDALRIEEKNDCAYRSKTRGVMHACGHDGHTAMLLGAAKILAETRDFDGIVRFVFQPAEEWGRGMQAMLDDGLLQKFPFEEAYGVHNYPGLPVGCFATRTGAFMAAEDNFEISLTGTGGHSSRPNVGRDALVAACATVTALQTVVSRRIDPAQLAVLSVTELTSDGTRNVIAGNARISGDARSFDGAVSARIEQELERIAKGTALSFGCDAEVAYSREFVPVMNDAAATQIAIAAARAVADSPDQVDADAARISASEDFARLLEHVPGNFMFIGNGDSQSLHHPSYDFDDRALPFGVRYFTQVVQNRLPAR